MGCAPDRFLTYTEDGRMSAILTLDDRKLLSVSDFISAPANERAEAFASMTAYAGRYTLTGQEVVHPCGSCLDAKRCRHRTETLGDTRWRSACPPGGKAVSVRRNNGSLARAHLETCQVSFPVAIVA
jgi:hypothetical protein